jgi:hypothetical protein
LLADAGELSELADPDPFIGNPREHVGVWRSDAVKSGRDERAAARLGDCIYKAPKEGAGNVLRVGRARLFIFGR